MVTLSSFSRRLVVDDRSREVTLEAGEVRWLDAQRHSGENTGSTPSHVIFVELEGVSAPAGAARLGPADAGG